MNIIDIVIGVILILGFYKGFKNGLILEITSLLGLIIGIIGAFYITRHYGSFIGQWLDWQESYLKIATFILSFIILVILVSFLGKMLTKILDYAALGFINNLFGGAFGVLKFALFLSVFILLFNVVNSKVNVVEIETLETSIFYPILNEFSEFIWPKLVEFSEDNDKLLDQIPELN